MRLTEALSPLFESFKELRTYLEMAEEQGEIANSSRLRTIYRLLNSTVVLDPSIPSGRLDARGLNDLFRWAMQHPNLPSHLKPHAQTGRIIKIIRTNGLEPALMLLEEFMTSIRTELDSPSKQKPEITKVTSGRGWDAYQLHNYAAAREVCNRYGSNFCIGSSTSSWFDEYGEDRGRDTFAIITNNKPVIVHAGDNGFLVTSSDNNSDIDEMGEGRGDEANAIIDDFGSVDTAVEAIKSVVPRRFHRTIEIHITEDSLDFETFIESYGDIRLYEFREENNYGIKLTRAGREYKAYTDWRNGEMSVEISGFPPKPASSEVLIGYMKIFVGQSVEEDLINDVVSEIIDDARYGYLDSNTQIIIHALTQGKSNLL